MWCTLHLNNSYLSTPSLGLPLNAFLDYTTHHTPDPEVSKETEHTGEVPYPSTPFKRTQREKQIHHAHLWVSHVFKPNKKLDFFLLSCALLTSSLTNLQTFLRNSEQSCYKSPGHPGERERKGNWGSEVTRAWQLALSFCFLRLDTSVIYQRVPTCLEVMGNCPGGQWQNT